jgi:hypothetical protein
VAWQVEWLTPLKKIIVKNANTRAQGGEHLLVFAHLQRRWNLSGSDGFGALSGFGDFQEVKCIFSIDRMLILG